MRRLGSMCMVAMLFVALSAQSYPLNNFDSGSASAPSRAYRIDPLLGSYRIESGNEGFATNGTTRWHWSSSLMHLTGINLFVGGEGVFQSAVGIGRQSPQAALHVVGSIASTGTLALQNGLALGSVSTPTSTLHVGGTATISGASNFLANVTLQNAAVLLVPNGTAAAPSLAPASETGNGLFRRAASQLSVTQSFHVAGTLHVESAFALGAHVVAVGDNGVADVENAEVLTGNRSLYLVDCLDANGCTLHLAVANYTPGTITQIVSISANGTLLVPATVTNVSHAASAFSMGVNDSISFRFVRNRSGASYFIESSRSNN